MADEKAPKRKFSLTAAAVAAIGAPLMYGGMVARNQINAGLQSINPVNYLQGTLATAAPLGSGFSRIYNALNPRAAPNYGVGGGGNIDITPIVEAIGNLQKAIESKMDFRQITSAMSSTNSSMTKLLTESVSTQKRIEAKLDNTKTLALIEDLRTTNKAILVETQGQNQKLDGLQRAVVAMVNVMKGGQDRDKIGDAEKDSFDDIINLEKGDGYTRVKKDAPTAEGKKEDKGGGIWGAIMAGGRMLIGLFGGIGTKIAAFGAAIGGVLLAIPLLGTAIKGIMSLLGFKMPTIGPQRQIAHNPGRDMRMEGAGNSQRGRSPVAASAGNVGRSTVGRPTVMSRVGDFVRGGRGAASAGNVGTLARGAGSIGKLGGIARLGSRLLPGVGLAMGAMGAVNAAREGRWVEAGANVIGGGLSLLPGIGGIAGLGVTMAGGALQDSFDSNGGIEGVKKWVQPSPMTSASSASRQQEMVHRAATAHQTAMGARQPESRKPPVQINQDNRVMNYGQGSDDRTPIGFQRASLPEVTHARIFGDYISPWTV